MDPLAVIEKETARFADVLADTPAEAAVPTCPNWNAGELLWHLTEVHLFWTEVLRTGALTYQDAQALEEVVPGRPASVEGLLELRQQATAGLGETLSRLDDSDPRWTWWEPDQTVGFIRRMQTYEATMHRVDAERAAHLAPSPFLDGVAAGAVDHCADVMWGWMPEWARYTSVGVVELHATDLGKSWPVEAGRWTGTGPESGRAFDEPRAVRATGGEPTAGISARAQDLALWAWGRGSPVNSHGDAETLSAMQDVINAGIQ